MKFSLVSRRYIAATVSICLLLLLFVVVGVEDVAQHLRELPLSSALLAFICVLTTPFWVTLRFWRVLAHFGVRVSWSACLQASSAGQVASLLVMPLFGQVAGRQLLLARSGLSPESNAALIAATVALILWLAPMANFGSTTAIQSHMSYEASDSGRWAANAMAFEAWKQSPLLGIGLGGFVAISPERFGFPMVIHSTPLWILAELGLVGGGAGVYAVYVFVRHLRINWRRGSQNRSLLLLLIAFSLFCLLHEILFQRIFWFALGILLAQPALEQGSSDREGGPWHVYS